MSLWPSLLEGEAGWFHFCQGASILREAFHPSSQTGSIVDVRSTKKRGLGKKRRVKHVRASRESLGALDFVCRCEVRVEGIGRWRNVGALREMFTEEHCRRHFSVPRTSPHYNEGAL